MSRKGLISRKTQQPTNNPSNTNNFIIAVWFQMRHNNHPK